jgi:hypothetical protein
MTTRGVSDEDLILYFYGEAENAPEIAARLAASAADRERYAALESVLRAADEWRAPEPLSGYGARVWHRIEGRLPAAPRGGGLGWAGWRLAWAGVLLAAIAAAFFLGRSVPVAPGPAPVTAFSEAARARILQAAVAHHLETAERLLAELDNGSPTLSADLESERRRAAELVEANRLYRQAAAEGGLAAARALLEELEPLLLELAHAPAAFADASPLRQRLAQSDLLFKVRILSDRLQRQTQPSTPPRRTGDVL